MKITCTEETKKILVGNYNFPDWQCEKCQEIMGINKQECLNITCPECKLKNIEWRIKEKPTKGSAPKTPELTIREIAEALSKCSYTDCNDCCLDEYENCSEQSGKMILDLLESTECAEVKPEALTWDQVCKLESGQIIYRRNRNNSIDEVVFLGVISNTDTQEDFAVVYYREGDSVNNFYFRSPQKLNARMKLYAQKPEN